MDIKPIETLYNGYRFRSRLEARWAVYFDALSIRYDYEPEGFDLGAAGWYLPDFWLPEVKMWAEVKPGRFSPAEHEKCEALAKGSGYPCLLLDGPPAARNYWAYECGFGAEREPEYDDYVLYGPKRTWQTEGFFYRNTEAIAWAKGVWDYVDLSDWFEQSDPKGNGIAAINAARQARFEHGNRG